MPYRLPDPSRITPPTGEQPSFPPVKACTTLNVLACATVREANRANAIALNKTRMLLPVMKPIDSSFVLMSYAGTIRCGPGPCPYFFNRIRTHPGLNLRTAVRRERGKIKLAANRSGWVLGPFGTWYRLPT